MGNFDFLMVSNTTEICSVLYYEYNMFGERCSMTGHKYRTNAAQADFNAVLL